MSAETMFYAPLEPSPYLPVQRVHAFRRTGNVWLNGGMIEPQIANDQRMLWRLLRNMSDDYVAEIHLYTIPLRPGGKAERTTFLPTIEARVSHV